MAANVFVKDGIEIRRLRSGHCVLEDEWEQFAHFNKVLHLSYMLKNEPFEKLPVSYRPVQRRGHHPPRLSLGFAIRKELAQFRRVAIKEGLETDMDLKNTIHLTKLADLVLGHLNKLCGLPPDKGMTMGWIHSREGIVAIELETNYKWWLSAEKLEEAVDVIKEHFNLPSDAKPKWYLEDNIDEKEWDEYLVPMSAFNWTKVE